MTWEAVGVITIIVTAILGAFAAWFRSEVSRLELAISRQELTIKENETYCRKSSHDTRNLISFQQLDMIRIRAKIGLPIWDDPDPRR